MQSNAILSDPHIDEFCNRWHVAELSLDNSHFDGEKDLGISIKFDPTANWSLRERLLMHKEFEELTGKPVRLRRTRDAVRGRSRMRIVYNA